MKSKTSCFNLTIFKKNITHYWPIWFLYLGYLLFLMPVEIWSMMRSDSYYETTNLQYHVLEDVLGIAVSPSVIFVVAVVAAMAVFSYLFTAKNANMIHSLPVNRTELYVTNYFSGLCFLLVPQLISFAVSVLVCVTCGISCIQYLLIWLLYAAGMTLFAYSMAVFVAMFTGQLLALPLYYFILNFLYVGCTALLTAFEEMVCYGVTDVWNPGPGAACVLSPLYYLTNYVGVSSVTDTNGIITDLYMGGGAAIACYALVGLLLFFVSGRLYKNRRIESAGDMVSIGIIKPIFRWGVALCGGFSLSFLVVGLLNVTLPVKVYSAFIVSIIICGFLCFFAAEMFLEKCFRVFQKKRLMEWGGFTIAAIGMILLFWADAFGIESAQPQEEEIETAFVYLDYPIMLDEDEVPEILQLQKAIIDSKREFLEAVEKSDHYYYVTFRYVLKDGSFYNRRYQLPLDEEYLSDETSVVATLISMECDTDRLTEDILGMNYEDNRYYSGTIDLYSSEGDCINYVLNEEEIETLVEAVLLDIEDGNYNDYYIYCTAPEDEKSYMSGISLNCYNRNGGDVYDYYYNYGYQNSWEAVDSTGCYVKIGPKCEHVIAALEELQITDDERRLITYEEYKTYLMEAEDGVITE